MDFHPKKFEASIGGYFGPSYEVKLQSDGTLFYLHNPDGYISPPLASTKGITVSDDQWREFRKALDRANVWAWEKYYDSDILDGTQWDLKIKYRDASLDVGGSNSFPPEQEFEQFRAAVMALLGGKEFG